MNKWIIGGIIGILLFSGIVAIKKDVFVRSIVVVPTPIPTPTPDPLAPKNFLILGYGGGTHEGGLLTDTMIVAHVVPKTQMVYLISIPRDVWVPLPLQKNGVVEEKINAAYAYGFDTNQYLDRPVQYQGDQGGANLAKHAASLVTGYSMDGYISLSFDGFKNVVSTLGPVTVKVPYTFEDAYYPIEGKEKETCEKSPEEVAQITATLSGELLEREFMCRYEAVKFDKGEQVLEASPALQFVRSRHSETNPGDFFRSLRQQALISGIVTKLKTLGGLVKLPILIPQITKYVATDITPAKIFEMIKLYGNPLDFRIARIPLTEENVLISSMSAKKQYILVPKEGEGFSGIKLFIDQQIATLSAVSTKGIQ